MRSHQFWNFIILLVACTLISLSEASNLKKPIPSALVVGTVYCDTCFHQDFSTASHFIPGASVEIACRDTSARKPGGIFRQVVKTNERGEFKVQLPLSISKHVNKIKGCSVKIIRSSEPFCAVGSRVISSSLHLKSKKERTHVFSAGFFTFRPLKQPEVCDQKPSLHNSPKKLTASKAIIPNPDHPTFFPPIQDPSKSDLPPTGQNYLPPLPALPKLPPLPQLPPLPPLPGGVPFFPHLQKTIPSPVPMKMVSLEMPINLNPFFPANPLLPPPSTIPPIFPSPSPPPSVLPFPPIFPFPGSPPPPPRFIFPPLFPFPGSPPSLPFSPPLIPGVPPQPRPIIPAPFLPAFPFQPTPGFPRVPSAVTVSTTKANPSKENTP